MSTAQDGAGGCDHFNIMTLCGVMSFKINII